MKSERHYLILDILVAFAIGGSLSFALLRASEGPAQWAHAFVIVIISIILTLDYSRRTPE